MNKKQSSDENIFFITAKESPATNIISGKSKESMMGVGITQQEFLHLIQDLEDQNLFILGNIEQTEAELEQINLKSVDKYSNEEKMISQLQKNIAYFEQLIHEKKIKKAALESQMAKIRG